MDLETPTREMKAQAICLSNAADKESPLELAYYFELDPSMNSLAPAASASRGILPEDRQYESYWDHAAQSGLFMETTAECFPSPHEIEEVLDCQDDQWMLAGEEQSIVQINLVLSISDAAGILDASKNHQFPIPLLAIQDAAAQALACNQSQVPLNHILASTHVQQLQEDPASSNAEVLQAESVIDSCSMQRNQSSSSDHSQSVAFDFNSAAISPSSPSGDSVPREPKKPKNTKKRAGSSQRTRGGCKRQKKPLFRPLPQDAVKVLQRWLESNMSNPYPSAAEKAVLVQESGLQLSQVDNWMSNVRHRLKLQRRHQG